MLWLIFVILGIIAFALIILIRAALASGRMDRHVEHSPSGGVIITFEESAEERAQRHQRRLDRLKIAAERGALTPGQRAWLTGQRQRHSDSASRSGYPSRT